MTKREKIIVIVMCLTVVLGFYMIFIEPASQKTVTSKPVATADMNKFLGEISQTIEKDNDSVDVAAHIMKQAASSWVRDPFVTSGYAELSRTETGAAGMLSGLKYSYSGYLKMNNKMIAIINGMEYETREELLDGSRYVVMGISPDNVILESGDTGEQLVIPLEDNLKGDI